MKKLNHFLTVGGKLKNIRADKLKRMIRIRIRLDNLGYSKFEANLLFNLYQANSVDTAIQLIEGFRAEQEQIEKLRSSLKDCETIQDLRNFFKPKHLDQFEQPVQLDFSNLEQNILKNTIKRIFEEVGGTFEENDKGKIIWVTANPEQNLLYDLYFELYHAQTLDDFIQIEVKSVTQ